MGEERDGDTRGDTGEKIQTFRRTFKLREKGRRLRIWWEKKGPQVHRDDYRLFSEV